MATIVDIATTSGGGTPSKADASYWKDGDLPWVSPKDMKRFLVSGSEDTLTTKALDRLTLVPAESVLVVVRSGILSRTLPVAINVVPVTINQDMRAFVPSRAIVPRYVAWQLIANEREILDRCAKDGTTVASIEGPALSAYPFAVAPAAEQTRIVDKLEELLSDLDAGVAELKAAQKKLAQYRQSLLKAAVEGRLTEAWRAQHGEPEENGAQLLARILHERRARWEAKQFAKFEAQGKTPPTGWRERYAEPVPPSANVVTPPALGWAWATLDQLAEFITSGSRGWADYYANSGATFIRSQNINRDWLDLSDIAYVNPPENSEGSRTRVRRDDLLLTITGANVGKAAAVAIELDDAYVSQHVALIRPIEPRLTSFLHLFLTSAAGGRGQLNKEAYGAGKPGLNLQQVAAVLVPLPSATELTAIMEEVDRQFLAASAQEEALAIALRQSAAQRKNILQAAFSGKLVPQDPNDEPASVLLERIRAEQAARAAAQSEGTRAARRRKETT